VQARSAVKVEQAGPVMNPISSSFIRAIVILAVLAVVLFGLGLLVPPHIKELAGIGRHRLDGPMAALRAGDD